MNKNILPELMRSGTELLAEEDPTLYALLEGEYERQQDTLVMVASCSIADPSVLACQGSVAVNVTAEGYPGKRYHAGCERIDGIEQLAIDRAKAAFKARYANVQPHSATSANYIVMSHLLAPGDTLLGMGLRAGGHLTHGSKVSLSGQYFRSVHYGVEENGLIDYEQAARMAREFKPKLIICGATAYSRIVDFRRFREIADEVGAYLLADIAHIAGLVVTGLHPSPIDHAHFTTTCTHKQLYGPRGGLILIGRDHEALGPDGKQTLTELMRRAVFPYFQGAPILNAMAAKARALAVAMTPGFRSTAERIVEDARALAQALKKRGYHIVSGGTDNHIVLVDVGARGFTGLLAEQALEACGIIVNKNSIPGDKHPAELTSGVRLGTNTLAGRGYGPREMDLCADLFHRVLSGIEVHGPREYSLSPALQAGIRAEVRALSRRFPIPRYTATHAEPQASAPFLQQDGLTP